LDAAYGSRRGWRDNVPDGHSRVLFLVATPLSASLDSILCLSQPGVRSGADRIDWNNVSGSLSQNLLPEITHHLCAARHYALGVMNRAVWEDMGLSHLDKFRKAKFWEHRGPRWSASGGMARTDGEWGEKEIWAIEAIQYLGGTDKSDTIITNECMSGLSSSYLFACKYYQEHRRSSFWR